jgi:hypothetical protein
VEAIWESSADPIYCLASRPVFSQPNREKSLGQTGSGISTRCTLSWISVRHPFVKRSERKSPTCSLNNGWMNISEQLVERKEKGGTGRNRYHQFDRS